MMHNGLILIRMSQTWGDPWGYEDYTFELFHVFGDPSMEIWSALPQDLDVTYSFSGGAIDITVEDGGNPINGALVCISQESGFYSKGSTGASGTITIDTTSANILEEITLVVSYHNYKTYLRTFVLNQQPEIPSKPNGPTNLIAGTEYTYTTSATDPDEDQLWYRWRWGDGVYSEWEGPYASGETASSSHSWKEAANYKLRVMTKDEFDQETDWSESLEVTVTKSRSLQHIFIQNLMEKFPNIFRVLQILLGI